MNWDQAIQTNKMRLNNATNALNQFVAMNADKILDDDVEFRTMRQAVKRLQLEQKELNAAKLQDETSQNLATPPSTEVSNYKSPSEVRSRENTVVDVRLGNTLGERYHTGVNNV